MKKDKSEKLIKKVVIKNPERREQAMIEFAKRLKEKGY